jgi:hypothetical protein
MRAIFGIANAITLVRLWRSSINLQFLSSTVLGHLSLPLNVVYQTQSAHQTDSRTKQVDMLQPIHLADERPLLYATASDFCRAFTEELYSLYLLSLLLTADNDEAEKCFVNAIGECGDGIGVFMEWASSWARRAIFKHAIQVIRPVPERTDSLPFIRPRGPATSAENNPFAAILALGAFERFVYVMSILEGQSEQDCAILLGCARRDVVSARVLALTRLSNSDAAYAQAGEVM